MAEAYRHKETFRDRYRQKDWHAGRGFLKAWITMARKSWLTPMCKAAQTIRGHWKGILRWFCTGLNHGIIEGLNSLIQAAKRKSRGYRNHATFRLVAFLIGGRWIYGSDRALDLGLPTHLAKEPNKRRSEP